MSTMVRAVPLHELLGLGLALAAGATLGTARAADLQFDPRLAASPPRVSSASFELLARPEAAGNAVLRVRFAEGGPKGNLVIQGGPGPTLLRDDGKAPDTRAGDGIFAAVVKLNTTQLAQERARRNGLVRKYPTLPQFDHRVLVRWLPFQVSETVKLEPGIVQAIGSFTGVPGTVDPERELMIRDPAVVEDPLRTYEPCSGAGTPMGAWTFGRLVTEIANQPVTGIDPADLAEHWLEQWKQDLPINGFVVPNRAVGAQRFLDLWPRLPSGKLDLAHAPFRLLAIVNRQDLRGNAIYGGGDAGEARLVFGAVNCTAPTPSLPEVLPFTTIFEYGVPKSGCLTVRDWARQWHDLGTLVLGSGAYNAALQAITDQFTLRDANPARLPNRSAINQVRTNEFALALFFADTFWQLRESRLVSAGPQAGLLEHTVLAQSPDDTKHNSTAVRDFINANTADILADAHEVPLQYPVPTPFRGAVADPGAGRIWNATGIVNLEARRKFSLAACDACHTTETGTQFLHIKPRAIGATSQLSHFLTGVGMPMSTPVSGEMRTYNDLLARQAKLDATANMSCSVKTDIALEELFIDTLGPFVSH